MKECVFCKKIETMDLHWSKGVIDFEPLNPVVPSHRLIVPVKHVDSFTSSPEISAWVMEYAAEYANRKGGEWNLITSKGKSATQSVFHLHVHLIPRFKDDGLKLPWTGQKS
jgi:histidine triad (HIT) family protein